MLLVVGLDLALDLCFLKGFLLITERNRSLDSLFTHLPRSPPLLLNPITVSCPLTLCLSTLMLLYSSTMRPISTGLSLR
ncbi:hypothetical protein LOK49_LG02G01841 [Camellia lanceoleosa]|uniref:Uncharacterized protein n=1 Tax=Camellia lanceoleosa TaxID=1840588 RepID=A0ACC0IPW3_9ERIC|nr:hypothetical protein LOK49_LG02G01841 [Camellia lanceoleosa]